MARRDLGDRLCSGAALRLFSWAYNRIPYGCQIAEAEDLMRFPQVPPEDGPEREFYKIREVAENTALTRGVGTGLRIDAASFSVSGEQVEFRPEFTVRVLGCRGDDDAGREG